jgi:hypothetical protein
MVFEQVKGKVSVNFEDLGLQQVKNIAESIRAYRAVLSSGTVSAEPQKKVEAPREDRREGSDRYDRLMSRLSPLLCRGIEDVLQRWKKTLNPMGVSTLGVSAPINGFYRIVGATYPADHPMRQNSVKFGEGFQWYFADRKKGGFVHRIAFTNRKVFDLDGQELGFREGRGRPAGVLAHSGDAKWRYYRPIFEKSTANPWSDRVVGVININSTADDADNLFKTAEFQQQVDAIASEVSPYLDAIQVLVGEEKL